MKHLSLILFCFIFSLSVNAQGGPPPIGCPTIIWNGSSWSNTIGPDTGISATIAGNYDTTTHGSFSCCTLNILTNVTLTIQPNTYVLSQGDATVNGLLSVEDKGSFIQVNELAKFTLGSTDPDADAVVKRQTSLTLSATEVTYWSSPVAGKPVIQNIGESGESWGGYRYSFNTANFEDSYFEINNDNTQTLGPDNDRVDDNGDDWFFVGANTIMQPGFGIIARQAPGSTPAQVIYDFNGPFHTGTYSIPFERNDQSRILYGGEDQNPAFTGNPYASAIDVDLFFRENLYNPTGNNTPLNPGSPNGVIDGVVYLWSHYTQASSTANGNQSNNFAQNNYATINGSMQTAGGGDPTFNPDQRPLPNRYIPSAQGFFVNLDPARPSRFGNVVFTNAMRVTANNEQFFKTSQSQVDNKVWLNLTSNNGIGQQIGLAYLDGATAAFDGRFYDAEDRVPKGKTALLYFNVEGTQEKIVIQGKATSDLSSNEVVSLGFVSTITEPTDFTITIDHLQGAFMSGRDIYLKDNLLNTCNNLSASSYTFTSEVGEFNDRFELVFLSCDYTEACNTIFDAFAGSIAPQGKCGKYRIKAPKGHYTGYDVVLTHEGTDINIPANGANTTFLYTENGIYTVVLSIYDEASGALCYRGDINLVVDCFKNNKTLTIYPNPARDIFSVTLNDTSELIERTVLRNLMGTVVKQSNTNTIGITDLKPGAYFVEVTTKSGKTYRKQLVVK